MGNMEKKIVQNVVWGLSIVVGLLVAEKVYNVGIMSYLWAFHSYTYDEMIKKSEEEA